MFFLKCDNVTVQKVQSTTYFEHHCYKVLFLTSFREFFKGLILVNGEQQEQSQEFTSIVRKFLIKSCRPGTDEKKKSWKKVVKLIKGVFLYIVALAPFMQLGKKQSF